jgi:hypothetical protein
MNATSSFVPALELCRAFHDELIAPQLQTAFPRLRYSTALLGTGSEILGFDTERSTDHHWGPRLQVFLSPNDLAKYADAITALFARTLPRSFRGYPTNWGPPDAAGVQRLVPADHGPIRHRVIALTTGAFMQKVLGFDPRGGVTLRDWLSTPSQLLLGVTAGAVYHDGLGELEPIRETLTWYPHDVWLYLIACQWRRIAQEEAFIARTGEVGDELGSRILAARLVRDAMRLCFLFERRYAPYSKWFGTAFARIASAEQLNPSLEQVLQASDWQTRDQHLGAVYELVAALHNRLDITVKVDPATRPYYGRPFRVLGADRFVDATRAVIQDKTVQALTPHIGGIDQYIDSTDVLSYPMRAQHLGAAAQEPFPPAPNVKF